MPPNFVLLDLNLSDIARLVAAIVRARTPTGTLGLIRWCSLAANRYHQNSQCECRIFHSSSPFDCSPFLF
jgi:hypothetical protein